MSEHLLWSATPAAGWLEAFPLGNGRLGAMVHGVPGREHLQINDGTAWSGSPHNERMNSRIDPSVAARALTDARAAIDRGDPAAADRRLRDVQGGWSQAYLPFADLHLTVGDAGVVEAYRRELDLATATHRVSYLLDGAPVRWSCFVSAADSVLVLRVETERPVDVEWRLASPLRVHGNEADEHGAWMTVRLPSDMPPPHEPDLEPAWDEAEGAALRGAVVVRVAHDGQRRAGGSAGVRRLDLVLATATTFTGIGLPPDGDETTARAVAKQAVDRALGRSDLAGRHEREHARRYGQVALDLGPVAAERPTAERLTERDTGLAALLFAYGRYLAVSSSAPGGLPSTLQGLWNDDMRPPWSSNYTINVNTQMNYWAAETADLADTLEPLVDLVEALSENGGATLYGARGWVAHHNTDAWAFTAPVGRGRADPSWAFWPMGGVWLTWLLHEHLRFGASDEFAAKRAWPILRGAAAFCLDWLRPKADGTVGTVPSTSPENHYVGPDGRVVAAGRSSTMDLVLIAGLFDALGGLAARLGVDDDPVVAEVRQVRPRIPGPAIGADGMVPEWIDDPAQGEPGHRHLSHLVFAYPGDTPDDPVLRGAVSHSIDDRGEDSTGWSLAWKLALRARLRQPGHVSRLLDLMIRPAPPERAGEHGGFYPNLMAAHPPYQIDGNFGYVAAVAEMLVQSHRGVIEILPSLPAAWSEGRVTGLVARPGVSVDIAWNRTGPTEIGLRARRPAGRTTVTVEFAGRRTTVDLTRGERVMVELDTFAPKGSAT
ncbi:glycoside hydrolase family 95 protein [Actinoplanes sp. TBRC 11911]|uniref:glycoside hydrolase family 95 protein n=1 Tax=Actinoplanes sp. TBRC 11911 TaxID=2729386 RepID=UPI00145F0E6C|nr:glycoside hydrolase family 95 protein [Actinoplanes sp. TBRC 11911]NMO49599.1 glycoside hydrolase family 95 protein [Actinoplanes sp. TBRC 11911]